jgi:type VI secretion system protein
MMLRLNIENVASLASGDPVEISLAEHGLVIGRAAHADWTLPDPANHVSSIHCEVDYRDGRYVLTDRSTNGTFINGATERIAKPVQLRDGDLLQVGHYNIRVEEVPDHAAAGGRDAAGAAGAFGGGIDWGSGTESAARPASVTKFGREAARPMFQSANDPMMHAFAPPAAAARPDPFGVAPVGPAAADPFAAAPPGDPFGTAPQSPYTPPPPLTPPLAPTPRATDPFGTPTGPAAPDPFGTMATATVSPAVIPHADPFGGPVSPPPPPASDNPWAMLSGVGAVAFAAVPPSAAPPAPVTPALPTPVTPPVPPTTAQSSPVPAPPLAEAAPSSKIQNGLFERLLAASGLERRDLGSRSPETVVDTIGQLLRQTADGLFKLLEARTRVRHQFGVGAQVTTYQRTGNNPLKWTRSPEQALKQMIGDPGAGFLEGTQAVLGAFEDIQAHEMAMMAAMQEAMQETIRRFAPDTIRSRISAKGWLTSVLPGGREAILWRAYESEFSAFADESEAAYLDLFAKQFKKAYERIVTTAEQKG